MQTMIITGANRGLGRALAAHFAKQYRVVALGRNAEQIGQTATELGCDCAVADVADWPSAERAIGEVLARHRRIDVLINCAGLYARGKVEDIDPLETEELMKANVLGPLFMIKAVVPTMKRQKAGHIININSQGGLAGKAERSVYQGSKWALTGITKSLQPELAPFGIKVAGLYPGALEQSMDEHGVSAPRPGGLAHAEVAAAVEFILARKSSTLVPELGIVAIED